MNARSDVQTDRILVWDLPVRLFHAMMIASFIGAWLTAESESWQMLHVTLGYTMAALVAWRVAWGVMGTRYARFSQFVRRPSAVMAYLKSVLTNRPAHFVGHNPAGAVAIVALLGLTLVVVATGYGYYEFRSEWLEDTHELSADVMLVVVILHVVGVAVGSIVHRENLVRSMITGRKKGASPDGISSPRSRSALALLAVVAALWWFQSQDGALTSPQLRPDSSESNED